MNAGPERPARPTLEAVAARAGVGRGTVSRVINGSPQVSPEAREAVQQAIEELGYVPNRAARTLVTRRTDTVALVVSESEDRVFGEPYFAGDHPGDRRRRSPARGLQLLLAMAPVADGARSARALPDRAARRRRAAGLAARRRPAAAHGWRRGACRPCSAAARSASPGCSCVDADNRGGARQAVEHLLGLGPAADRRRSPARRTCASGVDRLAGYRDALRRGRPAASWSRPATSARRAARAAMRELLARTPGPRRGLRRLGPDGDRRDAGARGGRAAGARGRRASSASTTRRRPRTPIRP